MSAAIEGGMQKGEIVVIMGGRKEGRTRFYQTAASVLSGFTAGDIHTLLPEDFDAPLIKLKDGTMYHEHVNYGTNPIRHRPTNDDLNMFALRVNKYAASFSQEATKDDRAAYLRGLVEEEQLTNYAKSIVVSGRQAIFQLRKIKVTESFTQLIAISI